MIIAGTWGSPVFWFRAVGEKEAIEARCYAIASLIFLLVAVCGVVLLVVEGYCRGIPAASGYDMHSVSHEPVTLLSVSRPICCLLLPVSCV